MKRGMTIKQIASLAGVSPTTVSFVLNNRKGVGDETRQKIMEIIDREQYTPNINSRRLSLKRSFNIALFTNDEFSMYSDLFATKTMNAVTEAATQLGYTVILLPQKNKTDNAHLISSIKQGNLDGIIVFQDIDLSLYETLHKQNIPVVSIDSHSPDRPYPKIYVNYTEASYTAVKYLISEGHKEIAYIGIERLPELFIHCLNGYKKAMSEASLPLNPQWVMDMVWNENNAGEAMELILQGEQRPTAVFCASDLTAIGAIRRAIQLGFSVPRDISVISIDDIFISEFFNPALTTIHVDAAEMGRKAMEVLNAQLCGQRADLVYKMPSNKLIVRESVARKTDL
jgi:DNA-binding LacI/PurR family transcriptional regulator